MYFISTSWDTPRPDGRKSIHQHKKYKYIILTKTAA